MQEAEIDQTPEVAAKHGASVAKTTGRDTEAYGELTPAAPVRPPKPFGGGD